jgi:hypothetical protein
MEIMPTKKMSEACSSLSRAAFSLEHSVRPGKMRRKYPLREGTSKAEPEKSQFHRRFSEWGRTGVGFRSRGRVVPQGVSARYQESRALTPSVVSA